MSRGTHNSQCAARYGPFAALLAFSLLLLWRPLFAGEAFFWGTYAGAELDLLVVRGSTRVGFECKATEAPRTSKSMRVAGSDLQLRHLYILHPGDTSFPIDEGISALALRDVARELPRALS